MNRTLTLCGFALATVLLAGCATSSARGVRIALDSVKEGTQTGSSLAKGRMLFARGEYGLAIEAFRLAVREAPDVPDGYNGLAAAYDMMGRFDLSGTYYEMALARSPSDGRIYRNMARSLKMQGRNGESEALLAEWDSLQKIDVADGPPEQQAQAALVRSPPSVAPAVEAKTATPEQTNPVSRSQAIVVNLADAAAVAPDKDLPKIVQAAHAIAPQALTSVPAVPSLPATNVTIALDMPKPAVAHAQAAIRIMNADGRKGIARRMQGYLARSGIGNTQIGDSDRRFARSWLVYPRSAQAQALALRKQLPFATNVVIDNRANRVVLLLGRNAANYDVRSYRRGRHA